MDIYLLSFRSKADHWVVVTYILYPTDYIVPPADAGAIGAMSRRCRPPRRIEAILIGSSEQLQLEGLRVR